METVAKGGLSEYILSFHFCSSVQAFALENLCFHVFGAEYFSASEIDKWHCWYLLLFIARVNFTKFSSLISTQESFVCQYVFAFNFLPLSFPNQMQPVKVKEKHRFQRCKSNTYRHVSTFTGIV